MIATRTPPSSSMRTLLRHPRFSLALLLLLLVSLLYLSAVHADFGPIRSSVPPPPPSELDSQVTIIKEVKFRPSSTHGSGVQKSLSQRLTDSEAVYQKTLRQRRVLIKHFGPTPKGIVPFPANTPPWPPYTLWDFFPPAFNCPWEVERIGTLGDGGKFVCGFSRVVEKPNCVIYSFGINHESSFEAEMLERGKNCQVWGYDFSVTSFGPEVTPDLAPRAHFHAYALGGEDRAPIPDAKQGSPEAAQMHSLGTLMKQNGHDFIDILKIDIEGWEFQTLSTLLKQFSSSPSLPFGQLQLEIHAWKYDFPAFLKWWTELEEAGLRPFWTEPNLIYANYNREGPPDLAEYSFINVKGNHVLISE